MILKRRKKRNRIVLVSICMALYLAACGMEDPLQVWDSKEEETTSETVWQSGVSPTFTPQPTATPRPTATPEPVFEEYDIKLMMVGDNLMHMGIVNTGIREDGTRNYDFLFDPIADFLEEADIKMINQETILGGNNKGFSGFPRFNSPTEVGEAIEKAGFNVVLHASNHAADKNLEGIQNCAKFWKQYPDVMAVGIYEDKKDAVGTPIIEVGGIKFAILNYTYSPNMGTLPNEIDGHLEMLCQYDEKTGAIDYTTLNEAVLREIDLAEMMADVVIVCPHWGTEYTTTPSTYQKKFALQMTQAGADVIIGTHPHVVQPVEWIEADNGNRALCFYSLGNYVSTQKQALCMLEAMAWITFRVTEDGISILEKDTGVVPMVNQYQAMPVVYDKVLLLEEYTEEKAMEHGIRKYGGVDISLEELRQWSDEVLGEWVLSKEQILGQDE